MEQVTCGGCRFDKNGKCHDWTVYPPEGGDLLLDDGVRLCYEVLTLCLGKAGRRIITDTAPCKNSFPVWCETQTEVSAANGTLHLAACKPPEIVHTFGKVWNNLLYKKG